MEPSQDPVAQDERRQNERVPTQAPTRLEIETSSIEARTENLSPGGVLLASAEEVRVVVTVDGEPREGHIVRCLKLPDGCLGWAIEFETPIE